MAGKLDGFSDVQARSLAAIVSKLENAIEELRAPDRVLDRRKSPAAIRPRPGDVVRAQANDVVVLPHPRPAKGRDPVVVLVEGQPVRILAEASTVNDAAEVTVASLGAMAWYSTGTEWWGSAVGGSSGSGGSRLLQVRRLTSGTSFTLDTATTFVRTVGTGGGGAGGGGNSAAGQCSIGSGGWGGATFIKDFTPTATARVVSYTIGSGGTGVQGAAGNNGTSTTLTYAAASVSCSAGGGTGGTLGGSGTAVLAQGPAAGAAPSATGGDMNLSGGIPGLGVRSSGTIGQAGYGGLSYWASGGGPGRSIVGTSQNGDAGQFGSGGGGAADFNNSPTAGSTGGAGGDGFLYVEEWAL